MRPTKAASLRLLIMPIIILFTQLWSVAAVEPECVTLDIENPRFYHVIGHGFNMTMSSQLACQDACLSLKLGTAGVDAASFCFCSSDYTPLELTGTTGCDSTCVDGSSCGGIDGSDTLILLEAAEQVKNITISTVDGATTSIAGQQDISILVESTGTYVVDWGDGFGPGSSDVTTKSFGLPGKYTITATLEEDGDYYATTSVTVYEGPSLTVECPIIFVINVENNCIFTSTRQGFEYVFSYSVETIAGVITDVSFNVPSEDISLYGSKVDPILTSSGEVDLTGVFAVILPDSMLPNGGFITRISANFVTTGSLQIYAIKAACDTGTYCGLMGQCTTEQCPVTNLGQHSCSSHFCPTMGTCSDTSVCTGVLAPSNTSYTTELLMEVAVASNAYVEEFIGGIWVPEGSYIGFGCGGSACLTANTRPAASTEIGDIVLDSAGAATTTSIKHDFQVMVRGHPHIELSPFLTCTTSAPIPTSEVPVPYTADTEQYVFMGKYAVHYQLESPIAVSTISGTKSILCQEAIGPVTLLKTEYWIELGTTDTLDISFSQGSPVFTIITLDGLDIMYHYWDDATASPMTWTVEINIPTEGQYVLQGNSSNVLNEVLYEVTVHIVPPVTDTWVMTFSCPCYTGFEFIVDLTFLASENPPWNVSFTAVYDSTEELFPNEFIDFYTVGDLGAAASLNIAKTRTFLEAGTYNVEITLTNEVSASIVTGELLIEEAIEDVSSVMVYDTDDGPMPFMSEAENLVLVNRTITVTPSSLKGTPIQWRVIAMGEDGTNVTYTVDGTAPNITFTLPKEQPYVLVVGGYNTVQGWVEAEPRLVEAIFRIRGFTVYTEPTIRKPNETVSIIGDLEVFTPLACVVFNYGDGSAVESYGKEETCRARYDDTLYMGPVENAPIPTEHIYLQEGVYEIQAIAFDDFANFTISTKVTVAQSSNCDMPIVEIYMATKTLSDAPQSYKSQDYIVSATATVNCNGTFSSEMWWEVIKIDGISGEPLNGVKIDSLPTRDKTNLKIPKLFLPYGFYGLSFFLKVTTSTSTHLETYDYTIVEIIRTDILAIMVEGAQSLVRLGFGQVVDISTIVLSIDPDDIGNQDFNVTIFCRETFDPEFTVLEEGTVSVFNEQTIPEILKAIQLTGGGCFGVGPGTVESKDFTFDTSSFCKVEGEFEFMAEVRKDIRVAHTKLTIQLTAQMPPAALISCNPRLCTPYGNVFLIKPETAITFTGSCVSECSDVMDDLWNIEAAVGETYIYEDNNPCLGSTVSEGGTTTLSGGDTECNSVYKSTKIEQNFIISELFTKMNPSIYEFKITYRTTNLALQYGLSQIVVRVNKPPSSGSCSVTPTQGLSLIDIFELKCTGWIDPEGLGLSTYVVNVIIDGVMTKLASENRASFNLRLPVGECQILVQIYDNLGAVTKTLVNNITSILPTKGQFDNFRLAEIRSEYSAVGDSTAVSLLTLAQSSIRDGAPWLSLSADAIANKTDEELASLELDLGTQNKEGINEASKMTIGQLSDAEVVIDLVNQILSPGSGEYGPLTLDAGTKEEALNIVVKVVSSIGSLDISSSEELSALVAGIFDAFIHTQKGINAIVANNTDKKVGALDASQSASEDYDNIVTLDSEVGSTQDEVYADAAIGRTESLSRDMDETRKGLTDQVVDEVLDRIVTGQSISTGSGEGAEIFVAKLSERAFQPGLEVVAGTDHVTRILFPIGFCPTLGHVENTDCNNEIGLSILMWPCLTNPSARNTDELNKETFIVEVEIIYKGERLSITNQEYNIILDIPKTNNAMLPDPVMVDAPTDLDTRIPFTYFKFSITTAGTAFTFEIKPTGSSIPSNVVLLIGHETLPVPSNFTYKIFIKDMEKDTNGTLTYFISSEINHGRVGRFFMAIASMKQLSDKDTYADSDFEKFDTKCTVRIFQAGCYYYDKYSNMWSNENVTVVKSGYYSTQCSTNHLSAFASGFLVSPASLDFEYIFSHVGFLDNLTLYVLLIVICSFYIIMMIWAHWKDRNDEERRGVIPLPDNQPEDKYLYETVFHTGPDQDASTDSQIMFIASGDYGETEIRLLPSGDGLYRRFGVDSFVMATSAPLGNINYLRLLHDNTGDPQPLDTWQVEKVVIRDVQTLDKFVFDINGWLAFDRDQGLIDRTFIRTVDEEDKSFSNKLYHNTSKVTNQDHIWMSMFLRPIGSRYGRKERVTVCAAFLFLSMLVCAIWYNWTEESDIAEGSFSLGPFALTPEAGITGFCILFVVYPFLYLISYVFKRARPRNLYKCRSIEAIERQRKYQYHEEGLPGSTADAKSKVELDSRRRRRMKERSPVQCLPWWTRVFAWAILLAAIGVSIFFIWAYGIQFGEVKTIKCFSSFVFSFFLSVIIVQWVNVFFVSVISSVWCNTEFSVEDIDCDEEIPGIKLNEAWLNKRPLDPTIRKWIHSVEGVNIENPNIGRLGTNLRKDREMKLAVRGIVVYCAFLFVLTYLVSYKMNANHFFLQSHLRKTFIKEGHLEYDFSTKVRNSDQWWKWCRKVVLQELRANRFYNGKPCVGLLGFLNDLQNRIVGYGQFRQIRVKRNNCVAAHPLEEYIGRCSGPRQLSNEDSTNFCVGWIHNTSMKGGCKWEEFQHRTAKELQTTSKLARIGTYGGGGYVFKLATYRSVLRRRMRQLQINNWIDKYTRAVILEFSIYNVNLNLYAICQITSEFTEGGGILPYWRFDVFKLSKDTGFWADINAICEFLFVLSIGFFTIRELWNMKNLKWKYFDSYWNMAEVLILFVSYAIIGLYFFRQSLVSDALDKFQKTKGNGYIRIESAAEVEQYFLYFLSLVSFFSILKLIKLLQFNNRMNMLALTIKGCWDELKIFFIAFGFIFFAFSSLFYFMFIWYLEEFSSIYKAIATSFKMMMGKFEFEQMRQANALSPLLFFVFSVFNSMILINIMLTIILQSFKQVKTAMENKDNRLNVLSFVSRKFRQASHMENLPKIHVEPVLREKDGYEGDYNVGNSMQDELPNKASLLKVGQLMKHINELYFDGRLDLNNPQSKKTLMGSASTARQLPFRDQTASNGKRRKIITSETH